MNRGGFRKTLAPGVHQRLSGIKEPRPGVIGNTDGGDWNTFQVQETPVRLATGVHDLYLTFHGARGLPDLRSFQFKAVP